MPLGDPVLDYDGLRTYDTKLKQWIGSSDSNLMHRTGDETIAGTKTFSNTIHGSINGNAAGLSTILPITSGGTGSATQNFVDLTTDQSISGAKTFAEGPYGTTSAVSASEIDLGDGVVFTKTIAANTTFTITGVPTGKAATFNLLLTNGGAYTVTWPSSVKWAGGTAPDLTADGLDVLTFLTGDGGTTWYGTVALAGAA